MNADQLAERGRALLNLGRPAQAEVEARRALALDPHHRDATIALTYSQFEQGRFADACRLAQELVGHRPDDVGCRITWVDVLPGCGCPTESVEQARVLVGLAPDNPTALVVAAKALAPIRQHRDEALALIDRALSLDPDVPEGRAVRAIVLLDLGERRPTKAGLDRLLADDPANARNQVILANLLALRGRARRAAKTTTAALQQAPFDPVVTEGAGLVLERLLLNWLFSAFVFMCVCAVVALGFPGFRANAAGLSVGLLVVLALWGRFSGGAGAWMRPTLRGLDREVRGIPRVVLGVAVVTVVMGFAPLWLGRVIAVVLLVLSVVLVASVRVSIRRQRG